MPKLPQLKSREVIRILESAGFIFVRQRGSHRMYRRNDIRLTIPMHNKPLKRGTLHQIIKRSGLELKTFMKK